jgi:CheY-like chemotaxis protein
MYKDQEVMKGNILILDNTTVIRSPWKQMLGSRYEITEAMGGFEAVRKLKTDSFDAVIVNISLKQIKGVEAIRKIRESFREIPIIVLYNPKDILDLKQAKVYGVDYTLVFPLEINNLLAALNHIVTVTNGKIQKTVQRSVQSLQQEEIPLPAESNDEYIDIEQKFYDGLSAISAGDIKSAITVFHSLLKITRIKKESWRRYLEDSLFQLGQCYATLKQYKKSNVCYLQFINKAPHNSSHKSALLYLGKNYLNLKDFTKAKNYLMKVADMRPYDSFSTQARKFLKKLESFKK